MRMVSKPNSKIGGDPNGQIETEKEFNVGSGQIVLPKTAKVVFSEHIDMDKLWTYLYNSQQKSQLI